MRKLISALVATTIAASSLTGAALARRHHDRDHDQRRDYVQSYCDSHSRDRDCRDWRRNSNGWDDNRYQGFYRNHYARNGDAAVAAIFGIIIGAAVANSNNHGQYNGDRYDGRYDGRDNRGYNEQSAHEAACAARYRSYRVEDNTFVGNDGRSYYCNL